VKALSGASKATDTLATAVAFVLQGSDIFPQLTCLSHRGTADADAVSTAQTAIQSAQKAVAGIAESLLTGQTAPAELRDTTAQGITDATTALQGVTST